MTTRAILLFRTPAIGLALLVATGCTVYVGGKDDAAPSRSEIRAPMPVSNHSGNTSLIDCHGVISEDTSTLIPSDWDEWCSMALFTVDELGEMSDDDFRGTCDDFWASDDYDLLDLAMGVGMERDEAIGMIDAYWTVC